MWTRGLNPEQVQAVKHNHGPMLILAGAGSGKTTVLVARTGRLISDQISKPENILVLTFTNKAARELKHRVANKIGEQAKGLWAGTFHSFGLRILREFYKEAELTTHFGVVDQSDSQSILRELLKDIKVAGKDKFDLDYLLELINMRRIQSCLGIHREAVNFSDEYRDVAEVLTPKFIKKLELMGVIDFEGLLIKPIELFKSYPEILSKIQNRFSQVMVDEFQDTNALQMKLIDEITKTHRNITVVGDDDQSIYGWRGAEVQNILNFPKTYKPCEVIRLERNYRSSSPILNLANEVIRHNRHRHGKVLKPENTKNAGELPEIFVFENEEDESEFVQREIRDFISKGYQPKDMAVLYRSNAQGGMIESVLRQHHIPYTVSGGTAFFDRKEIKDILAYLRFALHPNDIALRRIINTPNRGIGDTSIEKINLYAKTHHQSFVKTIRDITHSEALSANIGIPDKTRKSLISLMGFMQNLPDQIMNGHQPGQNLLQIFRDIGYRDYLLQTSAKADSADKKWVLIEIFSRILDSFVAKGGSSEKTLKEFVDAMELRDEQEENDKNALSLMTLHASKGLEFSVVLLLGVEEDLLPHRTLGTDVDEERRLFYVGLTRAKERLMLTRCKQRKKMGQSRPVSPSRFLLEIPKDSVKIHETGLRPVTGAARDQLLTDFFAKMDDKIGKKSK